MNVEVVPCPIVRESDGLAKSSRNTYLSSAQRSAALVISKAVFEGERLINEGERSPEKIINAMTSIIASEPLAKLDYIELVDSDLLESVVEIKGSVLGAVAVHIGKTRLIDNFIIML
jgi:pantoate--beta-alanine ligase